MFSTLATEGPWAKIAAVQRKVQQENSDNRRDPARHGFKVLAGQLVVLSRLQPAAL